MATVAIYNLKGGVGKTTVAVNFAWAAATLGGRRTLLWDLDGQAAASWILAASDRPAAAGADARAVIERAIPPHALILPTATAGLDLLPADGSLHGLDQLFGGIAHRRRLQDLIDTLAADYDCIVLDCPPGLGATGAQIMRAASLIVLPMNPAPLSRRALDEVQAHFAASGDTPPPIVPVLTMVDMRRAGHRAAVESGPGYPVIPMASVIETMADRHAAVGDFAPRSVAAQAFGTLWYAVAPHLG